MTDVRLSDLDAAASVTGTQEFEVNDSNTSKKVTGSQILSYVSSGLSGTYLTSYTETDPVVGAVTGIVKADGAGNISAAVSGTDYLNSDPTGVTGADKITNIISLTQAEYDAIGTKSSTTLYVIT